MQVLSGSGSVTVYLPILKVPKVCGRARITRDEDDGLDGNLRSKKLLRCDYGADGVGAKMVIEVGERATESVLVLSALDRQIKLGHTSRLLAIQSAG